MMLQYVSLPMRDYALPTIWHSQSSQQIMEAFSEVTPQGATPMESRLQQVLREYFQKLRVALEVGGMENVQRTIKPVNYLVLTDGEPCGLIVRCRPSPY